MNVVRLLLVMLVLVTAGAVTAHAQSIFLFAGPHTLTGTTEDFEVKGKLPVTNSGSETVDIKVRMRIEESVEGQEFYFCWDQCFPPTIFESGVVTLAPGEMTDLFNAYINPNGVPGKAVVCFDFFEADKPDDILTVCFNFNIDEVTSLDELDGPILMPMLSSSPSPAIESVQLAFEIPGTFVNAQLSIHNLFGNEIASIPVTSMKGSTMLDVTGYNPGVYFYTLTVDNQRLMSKKFVVKR